MAAREPQNVPTGSPGTTDKAESVKKGAPPESPECSRPCEAGKGATKSPKERNGSPGMTRSSSQLAPGKGQSSLVSERRWRGSKSEACSATTTTTSTPSRGSSRPAETPGSPPAKAGSLLSTSRVTGRREDVHGATKSPKKKASPGTTLSDSRSLARKGQSSSVSQSRSPSRKSEARSVTTTTTSTPSRRSQTSGSPLTKAGSSKSTSRDTGRRDDGHEAAKSPKKGSSGTVSSVSRSTASKRQRSSVTGIESLGRKSEASGGAAAPTSTVLGGSPLPAVAPRLPPTEARSPLSTSRDTELREDDHGATKAPKSEVSPRTNLSELQSPVSKGQSSRASGTRSTGYSSESRSKTATTLTPSRGSTRPAGVPRLPPAKAGSPQSTNRDSSHSRGNSTPRDTRASNMTPIASVSQAGSQTPLTTPYVTAPSTFLQAGRQTPLTTPYVTAPSTFSQAGSQLPSTTPFVTAPSTSNTPTTPYVSASSRLPHSVEPCADGMAWNMAAGAATAILHSKSPEAEESKSRSRGSSTRSPQSTGSKQGAADSSGGSGATRDASKSPKSVHKSPGGEPTTPARPSAVGKSSAVGGAHDSGGSKLDSSAHARKDKGAMKSAASSPLTASTDDSVLGYAKDQDLVALNTTPTQASLDKVMTGKGGVATHLAAGVAAETSGASFEDRLLRHLKIGRVSSIASKKKTATVEEEPPGSRKRLLVLLQTSVLTACEVGVCVSLVLMVASFTILWRRSSAETAAALAARTAASAARDMARCDAVECIQLNALLNASIDRGVDPCRDLHQYVCGGWSKRFPGMSVRQYTQWQANRTFVEGDELRRSKLLYAGVAGKAALVFDSCQDVLLRDDRSIEPIAQVLRSGGLYWPHVSSKMDVLNAMGFMDQTLDWAVFFDFELVPRNETACSRISDKYFTDGKVRKNVVRVKLSRHFLRLQRLVAYMILKGRFDSYLELLFVTLVDQTLKPVPMAQNSKFVETVVAPDLAEAARNTTSKPLCISSDGVVKFTPWLTSSEWQHFLVNLFQLEPHDLVYMEITCLELFTMFFSRRKIETGMTRYWDRSLASLMVSWYALQTSLMFAYAPAIELMYENRTMALEAHKRSCLDLSISFSGTSYGFLSLPRDQFSNTYWESRIIINRVTDSFLGEYISPKWRSNNATAIALLSLNRISLSLLEWAVNVVQKWSTFYPVRRSFVEVWKWASSSRVSDVYRNKRGNMSCCVRAEGVSALVPPKSTADGGDCCGLFDELVATDDWSSLASLNISAALVEAQRPYLVQPVAWNVPFFAPSMDIPLKYGALGSLLAALVAANYFETGDPREYDMLVNSFAACLNETEMASASSWSASAVAVARILALRNASLESLWKAFLDAWQHSSRDVVPSSSGDVRSDRRTDDRLFFVSWCFAVCGEPGASELCNVPLRSGNTTASGNFTSAFRCRPGDQMTTPTKCAE